MTATANPVSLDEILKSTAAAPTGDLAMFDSFFANAGDPLASAEVDKAMRFTRVEHVLALPSNEADVAAFFAAGVPGVNAASDAARATTMASIARDVASKDGFKPRPPAEVDGIYLMPTILEFVALWSKRAAVDRLACLIGAQLPGAGCGFADAGLERTTTAHVAEAILAVDTRIPFTDGHELAKHLDACDAVVAAYFGAEHAKAVAASGDLELQPQLLLAGRSEAENTRTLLLGSAGFRRVLAVARACLRPWFTLAFTGSFAGRRHPRRFIDVWRAQRFVYLFGYALALRCHDALPLVSPEREVYRNLADSIAWHFNRLSSPVVQARLVTLHNEARNAARENVNESEKLVNKDKRVDSRKRSVEALGAEVQEAKARARAAKRGLWLVVAVYAVITVAVATLVAFEETLGTAIVLAALVAIAVAAYGIYKIVRIGRGQ